MEYIIRQMLLKDIKRVYEIEKSVFSDVWEEVLFLNSLQHNLCWILAEQESERIAGYLIGQKVLDEFSIYNLAISKEYQKQGLGLWFTQSILNEMTIAGCRVFFLEVRRSNQIACNLYTKLGFSSVFIRDSYYSNPVEDAVIMVKDNRKPPKKG
ncbi:MAG: ribosomal protein S18-alanine N-acetyltransferase [Candidatus Cloacimonetes bacterium]|nr:ribosomal protein S18-alanine N-acetyltransferase [Candidatus Cloacimonadota bacterium]